MNNLKALVQSWRGKVALVVGDPIRDVYRFGRIERISQEAPVPVFNTDVIEVRRGGADNVAANLEALGLHVRCAWPARPWSAKTRYMVGHHQVFRSDVDVQHQGVMITPVLFDGVDVVVLSDYAKGTLTDQVCEQVMRMAHCPVVVDPKGASWAKYAGAAVMCPNHREYEAARETAQTRASIVLKQGEHGIDLLRHDPMTNFFVQDRFKAQAHQVYDVTGAGDVVTAVIAASQAVRGYLPDACGLATLAAGWSVGQIGTVAVSAKQLMELLT